MSSSSVSTGLPMFSMWVPFDVIEKGDAADAGKADEHSGKVRGIVSSENRDLDNDIILQKGIDWSWFMDHGTITYKHPQKGLNIIGEPLALNDVLLKGVAATEMEAQFYVGVDPLAKAVWEKSRMLSKASKTRSLGFSIEGHAVERDGQTVTKSTVYSVAVDARPRNGDTWFQPIFNAIHMGAADQLALLYSEPTKDALVRGASGVGYPAQGEAAQGEGGIGKLTTQSLQGVSDSAAYREALLQGVSDMELTVLRVLRKFPGMPWSQGLSLVEDKNLMQKMQGVL